MARMTPIQWTESARADLRAIYAYIARDSRVYARRHVNRIKRAVERIRRFPESGSVVEEWNRPDVREIFVGDYRIVYRFRTLVIEILAVFHGARRLPGSSKYGMIALKIALAQTACRTPTRK